MKPSLLLYLAHARDRHRCAVGPALAAAAQRAGWAFDAYHDDRRSGRHFGGWDEGGLSESMASGSLVAGGRHLDHALWLTAHYRVVAVGDPLSPLWPVIEAHGECLERSRNPAEVYAAVFPRLGQTLPWEAAVLDAAPQGPLNIVTAPFLYPRLLQDEVIGIDVTCDAALRARLEALGVRRFSGHFVDPERAGAFPGGLDGVEGQVGGESYATLTARLAARHAGWGRGTLLGDPDLIAAQLPLAAGKRLLPLYGRPQTDVIERAADLIRAGADPVYGRQFDDHDFFALARLGRGLQIVDPDPPFASMAAIPPRIPSPPRPPAELEPDDATLRRWAEEGRVLSTLVLWSGMIRELHCIPRILDLVSATGLRCGLVITADSLAQASPSDFALLGVPPEHGGVAGQVELLLGSTGRGVCAEGMMAPDELAALLADTRRELAGVLPESLMPKGWWPLVDTRLVEGTTPRFSWVDGRPVIRIAPRPRPRESAVEGGQKPAPAPPGRRDARRVIGSALRRYRLDRFYEAWRPFDRARPGPIDPALAEAVRSAGFEYMWTKASFGRSEAPFVSNDFVALPFTAGDWDGWSPFYTVGSTEQVRTAERQLLRAKRPGWLASNIDSILWLLPGEVLEKGRTVFRIAQLVAGGGTSGQLINVTPNVVARYARLLAQRSGKTAVPSDAMEQA